MELSIVNDKTGVNMSSSYPIGELKIKPNQQTRMSLGSFPKDASPKGFTVSITPEVDKEAIVSQITELDSENKCNLVLHVANYGTKTVKAQVWQM